MSEPDFVLVSSDDVPGDREAVTCGHCYQVASASRSLSHEAIMAEMVRHGHGTACPLAPGPPPPLNLFPPEESEPSRHTVRRLADLRAGNAAVERRINMEGVGLAQEAVLAIHIKALRRLIIGDDAAMDLRYSIAYQEEVAVALAEVEQQMARAKLTSRLVLPGNGKA